MNRTNVATIPESITTTFPENAPIKKNEDAIRNEKTKTIYSFMATYNSNVVYILRSDYI
jgi:hypothetical protein